MAVCLIAAFENPDDRPLAIRLAIEAELRIRQLFHESSPYPPDVPSTRDPNEAPDMPEPNDA
jgi:hypothetical protein